MERVLVTGAGGYIGTSLVPMLLAAGYKVRAAGPVLLRPPAAARARAARADPGATAAGSMPAHLDGVDHVIDLVAISNDPSGELFQEATYQINHESRVHCADAGQGGRRPALRPAVVLQHLRLPGPRGALRRDLPDQSADHLRQGQRDGRARRPAARRRRASAWSCCARPRSTATARACASTSRSTA